MSHAPTSTPEHEGVSKPLGRTRSRWAWGFTDRLPTDRGRRTLGAMAAHALGLGQGANAAASQPWFDLPDESVDPALPPPRLTAGALPPELSDAVEAAPAARALRSHGRGYPDLVRGLAGDYTSAPDLVVTPTTEAQIASLLRWASDQRVMVVPYGGGTSVVGGVDATLPPGFEGAVTLDLGGLAGLQRLERDDLLATFGAGTPGPAVEDALRPAGLTLRHFPQSFELSTVGGWVVTRAGGHFATVYTHIDDLTQAVRCVMPNGELVTKPFPASGAGPDPNRILLGSEGALGVVTSATFRVRPRPTHRARASVRFTDWAAATETCRAIAQARLYPANCRLLDRGEARLHRVRGANGQHVLLLAFEAFGRDVEGALGEALRLAAVHGGEAGPVKVTLEGDASRQAAAREMAEGSWRQAFFDAPYLQSALASLGWIVDTFETACRWSEFADLDRAVRRAVSGALDEVTGGAGGVVTCRLTHVYPSGPAPYYTFAAGPPAGVPRDADAATRAAALIGAWRRVKAAAMDALVGAGGTVTHHHAVGRLHGPWWRDHEAPEAWQRGLEALKRAWDPAGVLNPGVLVAMGRQGRHDAGPDDLGPTDQGPAHPQPTDGGDDRWRR